MKNKINVSFEYPSFQNLRFSAIIKKCIQATLDAENIEAPVEINVLITNDVGIQGINLASRGIDAPTDVLSFPMFDLTPGEKPTAEDADPGTELVPLGDMCISVERAQAQANEFGHCMAREINYLCVHSVLHLLGYDHLLPNGSLPASATWGASMKTRATISVFLPPSGSLRRTIFAATACAFAR